MSASVGRSGERVLARADAALYESKNAGRDRCTVWRPVAAAEQLAG